MPSDLCKHYRDWVLPPANDTPGGVQLRSPPHLETFKLVSPRQHTTTFCCTKTKNTTFSNVIMLLCVSLKLVHSHLFSSRRGGNYICICVSLCGVVMPQVDLIFGGFLLWGVMGGWVEWGLSYHTCNLIVSIEGMLFPFTHPLIPSGKTTTILILVLWPIGQGLLSLLCYQKKRQHWVW